MLTAQLNRKTNNHQTRLRHLAFDTAEAMKTMTTPKLHSEHVAAQADYDDAYDVRIHCDAVVLHHTHRHPLGSNTLAARPQPERQLVQRSCRLTAAPSKMADWRPLLSQSKGSKQAPVSHSTPSRLQSAETVSK